MIIDNLLSQDRYLIFHKILSLNGIFRLQKINIEMVRLEVTI